ncbi:hypothetical protein LINPERPRIM_LOCUS39732 [Linum perenne]
MYTEFNIHYLRMNDLFQWSQYGVETSRWAQVEWNRTEFNLRRGGGPSSRPMSRDKVMSQVDHDKWEKDMRASKEKNEKQRRRMEKKGSKIEKRLKRKDDEIESTRHDQKRVLEMTAEFAKKQDLLEKKESELERLKREKEETEEHLNNLKQTVNNFTSYISETAVVGGVKKTAIVMRKVTKKMVVAAGSYLYRTARAQVHKRRNQHDYVFPPPRG